MFRSLPVNAAALSGNASTPAMTKTRSMMILSYVWRSPGVALPALCSAFWLDPGLFRLFLVLQTYAAEKTGLIFRLTPQVRHFALFVPVCGAPDAPAAPVAPVACIDAKRA